MGSYNDVDGRFFHLPLPLHEAKTNTFSFLVYRGIVHNFAGLAAARFFLGLAESGLFPGVSQEFSLCRVHFRRMKKRRNPFLVFLTSELKLTSSCPRAF
jgi:hypothetical protein